MSQLRCRPGDLAVVVGSICTPELIGRVVFVDRLVGNGDLVGGFVLKGVDGVGWAIRPSVRGEKLPWRDSSGLDFTDEVASADSCLRPIRPNDGEDESLSWSKPLRREELA